LHDVRRLFENENEHAQFPARLEFVQAGARKGETVRVQDRADEFLFPSGVSRKSLFGAVKGKISFHADLTKPTLSASHWKLSL
jgi:hypothetical protein